MGDDRNVRSEELHVMEEAWAVGGWGGDYAEEVRQVEVMA